MKNETSINNFFLSDGQTALPKFTHGSLFSGIGGFDLAAEWIGWQNIFQCEIEPYCQKLLRQNFPECELHNDVKLLDGKKYKGKIDILTGGFPCQPFSVAGNRKGEADSRYLWKEMLRVITEIKPKIVVGENVPGIIGMALTTVCVDLENQGYKVQPIIIPACAVNAPHRRDRVWFIAYSNGIGCEDEQEESGQTIHNGKRNYTTEKQSWEQQQCRTGKSNSFFTDTNSEHGQEFERGDKLGYEGEETPLGRGFYEADWNREWTEVASELCRVDDGLPKELDKAKRITALGNAIVPQVAFQIFTVIDFVLKREGKKIINTVHTAHTNL